jgi:integrase/recombinase XerD
LQKEFFVTANILLRDAIEVFIIARRAESYSHETLTQYDLSTQPINPSQKSLQQTYGRSFPICRHLLPVRPDGSQRPLAGASIFHAWKAIRAFYKWASPEFGIPNPSAKIPAPRHVAPVIIPFSQDELKLLLKACESNTTKKTDIRVAYTQKRKTAARDKAIILTLLDTGVRASELCRLQFGDCNLRTGELVISPFGSSIKSRPRVVPLGASSRKALALYLIQRGNDKDALFRTCNGDDMDRLGVLQVLVRLGKKAGVKDVHPHRFRHTFAIQFLRNGGDIFSLQKMLGHTTLDMVKHYLDLAQSDVEAAHKRASPADNWRL